MTRTGGGIFDAHVDTLLSAEDPAWITDGSDRLHFDLPRGSVAGVGTVVTAICAEAWKEPAKAFERGFAAWRSLESPSIELLLGLEGCEPVAAGWIGEEDLSLVSIASLTWNGMNSLGGGIGTDEDLTQAGRRLAARLVRSGILLDVSHLCDRSRGTLLGMGLPVVATHCNCRKLCDIPRNLPDDDIREIASLGGVIGITFVPDFLGADADVRMLIDHVEHAVDVAGIEHVGFGSDFDGVGNLPAGIRGCESWPAVLAGLSDRGFKEMDVHRIAGSNWRRVFKQFGGKR
ncbi:MAG: Membrane dipeptidase (Peptidase family M19) [candidate division Hyd24-12 bacterium ADurb.Bin004]|nr:MAG: Membrane dipeptidase (Peptidase family M19) [candidate division Hyd24-12 bacterium ADurb.Bin004]